MAPMAFTAPTPTAPPASTPTSAPTKATQAKAPNPIAVGTPRRRSSSSCYLLVVTCWHQNSGGGDGGRGVEQAGRQSADADADAERGANSALATHVKADARARRCVRTSRRQYVDTVADLRRSSTAPNRARRRRAKWSRPRRCGTLTPPTTTRSRSRKATHALALVVSLASFCSSTRRARRRADDSRARRRVVGRRNQRQEGQSAGACRRVCWRRRCRFDADASCRQGNYVKLVE